MRERGRYIQNLCRLPQPRARLLRLQPFSPLAQAHRHLRSGVRLAHSRQLRLLCWDFGRGFPASAILVRLPRPFRCKEKGQTKHQNECMEPNIAASPVLSCHPPVLHLFHRLPSHYRRLGVP